MADVEKKVQADAATTYQIASVSKMFTAALVLKQVDRGRLSLNDPIATRIRRSRVSPPSKARRGINRR